MKEEAKSDWELTAKHLAGETDKFEQEEIRQLENENPVNKSELDRAGDAWTLAGTARNLYKIDEDKAWSSVKSKIHDQGHTKTEKRRALIFNSRFTRMAAGIALLAAIAASLYMVTGKLHSSSGMLSVINEDPKPLLVKLSDGSQVTLNKGAKLDYPENMAASKREVSLSGEAFFEIQHDEKKPFIVHTLQATITDLGTSFNLAAYKENNEVRVVVETGKVELKPENHFVPKLLLEKGDFGSYQPAEALAVKGNNTDLNYLSWKTRLVRFDKTPMNNVVDVLNKTYHSDIIITSDKVRNCRFTGTFSEESLETVVKVLQTAFDLKIDTKDKKMILSGKGC